MKYGVAKKSPLSKVFGVIVHPITIFSISQLMWIALTILWVIWYVERLDDISQLEKLSSKMIDHDAPLSVLVSGLTLLISMLIGSIWLFVVGQKRAYDFQQQQIFVSSVTHELRSPLASLLLMIETLKNRDPPSDVRQQLLENGEKDCQRLLRMVNQILLSARLDRGIETLDEKIESVDLLSMIKQASARSEIIEKGASQRIVIKCPSGIKVLVPRGVFLLLISNIIENAVKYSPQGEEIFVNVNSEDTENIIISVTDQGFGLDKHEIKKIFRIFHRGELANKKAIKGTGIGLFIVKTVSKILGGYVWVESDGPGHGSTFYLSLPKNRNKKIRKRQKHQTSESQYQ